MRDKNTKLENLDDEFVDLGKDVLSEGKDFVQVKDEALYLLPNDTY